jgi:Arc/MetJ-type ribon-helix-helix transcriptional regulator
MYLTAIITTIASLLSMLVFVRIALRQLQRAEDSLDERYRALIKRTSDTLVEFEEENGDTPSLAELEAALAKMKEDFAEVQKTKQLVLKVTRNGSNESVTLPPHYDHKVVADFLQLTA